MNSTPAASNARRTALLFGPVIDVSFSVSSARLIVATPTPEVRARSSARQRRSARAARIWSLVKCFCFTLTTQILNDMHDIIRMTAYHRICALSNEPNPEENPMKVDVWTKPVSRRHFIGGSDARIIMSDDEAALLRLWRE